VADNGGPDFFRRPNWRSELMSALGSANGTFEDDETRKAQIVAELDEGRTLLNSQLRTQTVKHVAFPWGISGSIARAAVAATGHQLAFAERPMRRRTVRAGDDRFGLMRLSSRFLTCLPGRRRRTFFTTVR
jgi:hypothetical protein